MLSKAIAVTLVLMMGAWLAGCGTVEGIGRDAQWVGEGIQDVARQAAE